MKDNKSRTFNRHLVVAWAALLVLIGSLVLPGCIDGSKHKAPDPSTAIAQAEVDQAQKLEDVLAEIGFSGEDAGQGAAAFLGSQLEEVISNRLPEFFFDREKPWAIMRTLHTAISLYRYTQDLRYLDLFCQGADLVLQYRADMTKTPDYKGDILSTWLWEPTYDTGWEGNKKVALAVWTAAVVYPLTEFCTVVSQNPQLPDTYKARAEAYLKASCEAMAVHENEWVGGPDDGEGHYIFPYASPMRFDGLPMPHNEQSLAGNVFLNLYRLTKDENYLRKASAMARLLRNRFVRDPTTGAIVWSYWYGCVYDGFEYDPGRSTNFPECSPRKNTTDMGHASWTTDFVANCFREGVVFDANDIAGLRATLAELMGEGAKTLRGYPPFRLDNSDDRPGYRETLIGTGWVSIASGSQELEELFFEHSLRMILRYAFETDETQEESDMTSMSLNTRAGITLARILTESRSHGFSLQIPSWTIRFYSLDARSSTFEVPITGEGAFYVYYPVELVNSGLRGDVIYSAVDSSGEIVHSEVDESIWAKDLNKYHYVTPSIAARANRIRIDLRFGEYDWGSLRVLWLGD